MGECGRPHLFYSQIRIAMVLNDQLDAARMLIVVGFIGTTADLLSTIDECNTFRPLLLLGLWEEPVRLPWHLADCAFQIALRKR